MPPFLLNSATDTLLKKDFDKYRELQQPHPFMERHGLGYWSLSSMRTLKMDPVIAAWI